jgi:hypothetical protein
MGLAALPQIEETQPPVRRASLTRSPEAVVAAIERRWPWVLAGLMLVDAALLLYMGRGLSFFYDEWDFVQHDYGGGLHSLLVAHVGNISVFPAAAYKVLFHVAGLNHYVVYRVTVVGLHLAAAGLVFVLALRRVSALPALLATALILFLGAAWEDLLWPFQIGYMLSIVGGLGAWLLLEYGRRSTDLLAMAMVILAAGSSSLGIPIMVGIAVEFAWQREWRREWIVLVPAALYLLWYLRYGESQVTAISLINAPSFAMDLAAAAFGGLVGRGLEWGRPLAVLGVLALGAGLSRARAISPRLASLIAAGISLWAITATARSTISAPDASRYIYLGAVMIVLVAVELLSAMEVTSRALLLGVVLILAAAVTGLTTLRAGAAGLRSTSEALSAELAALEIAAPYVPPTYQPDSQRAPQITAGPYLHVVRSIGSSPADTPSKIIESDTPTRTLVDSTLLRLEGAALVSVSRPFLVGPRAPLIANVAGTPPMKKGQGCWMMDAVGAGAFTEFILPKGGMVIRATAQPVQVVARRFAPPLGGVELGAVASRAASLIRLPPDRSGRPWFIRLASGAPAEVCGVG